jgi:CheY-like chemotaxis protein
MAALSQVAPLVACVNSSEDIVQVLAFQLRLAGYRAVTYATPTLIRVDALRIFLTNLQPAACVYTVSIPYEDSWQELQALRAAMPDLPFVLTTPNARALTDLVGPTEPAAIDLIGKAADLNHICAAVHHAVAAAPGRGLLSARS